MHRGGAIALSALLAGCIDIPGPLVVTDHDAAPADALQFCDDGDGDRWFAGNSGACLDGRELDCDDVDPARHPGAREVGDGVADLDCDQLSWDGVGAIPEVESGNAGVDLEVDIGAMALEFDGAQGHALRTLELGDSGQLLYTGETRERYVGVEAWQQFFSYDAGGDTRAMLVQTPAVLRFEVQWADGELTGITRWTIHSGGRIYRREEITLDSAASISNVTAYQALNGAAIGRIDWETNPGAPVEIVFGATQFWANAFGQTPWLCAFPAASGDLEIGMLSRPDLSSSTTRSSRISAGRDGAGADQVALQYDWITAQPAQPTSYGGNFQMIATASVGVSCQQVERAAEAWASPPELIVRGGTVMTAPAGEDQDGDLFAEGGGYWTVQAVPTEPSLELELASAGSVFGMITVRITGLRPGEPTLDRIDGTVVTRMLHGRDYLMSEVAATGDRWLVSLAMPGDVLRIVSP